MAEKRYVKVNGDRIYGYTELLAKRKDAVTMTQSEVDAWRRNRANPVSAIPEDQPKKQRRPRKPKTMVSSTAVDPDEILETLKNGDNVPAGGD